MTMGKSQHFIKQRRHDLTIDWLVNRLLTKPSYEEMYKCLEYSNNGYFGEFDVLTVRKHGNKEYFHYYEIKSNDNPVAYNHAIKQFKRAKNAFPECKWKFIYVTPQRIERMYL